MCSSMLSRHHLYRKTDFVGKALFSAKFIIPNLSHRKKSYIYEVLNLDEIKNELHSLLINYETNLMSLIRL